RKSRGRAKARPYTTLPGAPTGVRRRGNRAEFSGEEDKLPGSACRAARWRGSGRRGKSQNRGTTSQRGWNEARAQGPQRKFHRLIFALLQAAERQSTRDRPTFSPGRASEGCASHRESIENRRIPRGGVSDGPAPSGRGSPELRD